MRILPSVLVVSIVVCAAIAEDLLFQGVMLRGFLRWLLQPPTIRISLGLCARPGKGIDDELSSAPEGSFQPSASRREFEAPIAKQG
jgi:hypothetical protein